MPQYIYRNKANHEQTFEIFRSFEEYEIPPTREELLELGLDPDAEYERLVGQGVRVTWSAGWGSGPGNSGKGSWIILFCILGWRVLCTYQGI